MPEKFDDPRLNRAVQFLEGQQVPQPGESIIVYVNGTGPEKVNVEGDEMNQFLSDLLGTDSVVQTDQGFSLK